MTLEQKEKELRDWQEYIKREIDYLAQQAEELSQYVKTKGDKIKEDELENKIWVLINCKAFYFQHKRLIKSLQQSVRRSKNEKRNSD